MSKLKFAVLGVSVILVLAFTGCGKSGDNDNSAAGKTERQIDSTNIHPADTDIASLDADKDGKVYQCPMHGNVISDKKGTCAVCMMDLEEVSVKDAQDNFHKNMNH